MGWIDLLIVLVGGGWTTICFHSLMRHIRKRKLMDLEAANPTRPAIREGDEVGVVDAVHANGQVSVWFSMPGHRGRHVVTPFQAEAARAYLETACRCSNCEWKNGLSDTEVSGRITSELHGLIDGEVKLYELTQGVSNWVISIRAGGSSSK